MSQSPSSRLLRWAACYNVRDLGGYPTADGRETAYHAYVRADNLVRLTPIGQQALRDYGIHTIIDLRAPHELQSYPNPFAASTKEYDGITFINLRFGDGAEATAVALVEAAPSAAAYYPLVLRHFRSGVARVISTIAAVEDGGVLFHCHAGKDRTGIVAALLLGVAGVPTETIVADYVLSAEALRPHDEELLADEPDPVLREQLLLKWSAKPEAMQALLEHIDDDYGGIEKYLIDSGVTEAEIMRLRSRLLS